MCFPLRCPAAEALVLAPWMLPRIQARTHIVLQDVDAARHVAQEAETGGHGDEGKYHNNKASVISITIEDADSARPSNASFEKQDSSPFTVTLDSTTARSGTCLFRCFHEASSHCFYYILVLNGFSMIALHHPALLTHNAFPGA